MNNRTGIADKDSVAGSVNSSGYIILQINKITYQSHRIIFLYMTGDMPEEVDHINHIRTDNRWINLRESTRSDNLSNKTMYCNNKSGICGVFWHKTQKKWHAYINATGKRVHLGSYDKQDSAIVARKEAEIKYGYHYNHGEYNG